MTARGRLAALLAALTAALGWTALGIELQRSLASSLAGGHRLGEALFLYFRFFTILTNIAIASLMTATAWRLWRGRVLPAAGIYNAGLVYIAVTCLTYEYMLRQQWKPHGLQFWTDATIHDVVPALTLLDWLVFAPRDGARWRDALWMLVYPAAYFALTLAAGVFGEGYPYDFVDVDKLHYPAVVLTGVGFLVAFYALGLLTTGLSLMWRRTDARRQPLATQG